MLRPMRSPTPSQLQKDLNGCERSIMYANVRPQFQYIETSPQCLAHVHPRDHVSNMIAVIVMHRSQLETRATEEADGKPRAADHRVSRAGRRSGGLFVTPHMCGES